MWAEEAAAFAKDKWTRAVMPASSWKRSQAPESVAVFYGGSTLILLGDDLRHVPLRGLPCGSRHRQAARHLSTENAP